MGHALCHSDGCFRREGSYMVHLERLKRLADHLEFGELAHKEFDIHHYNVSYDKDGFSIKLPINQCGTAGCAVGECPQLWPEHFRWAGNQVGLIGSVDPANGHEYMGLDAAACFFGIPRHKSEDFFLSVGYKHSSSYPFVTREQVAAKIREYLA